MPTREYGMTSKKAEWTLWGYQELFLCEHFFHLDLTATRNQHIYRKDAHIDKEKAHKLERCCRQNKTTLDHVELLVYRNGLLLLVGLPSCLALPRGFHDEAYLDNTVLDFKDPIDFEFYTTKGGSTQVFLADRQGRVYWIDDPESSSPTKQLILDITDIACNDGSRGLLSLVLHPKFGTKNRWIYLYYTRVTDGACNLDRETGPVNRVARYEVSTHDNAIDRSTELILLETSRTAYNFHNGGDMKFGRDDMLYISTGDGGLKANSQDWSDLMGSILRVTESGDIPSDGNAFTKKVARCNVMGRPPAFKEGSVCAEIWAKGLRNPFRFAMDPNAAETRFYISDVGRGMWEEIDEGGVDQRGANYGWEVREGPCKKGSSTDCEVTDYTDPIYWYMHDGISGSSGGGSVVGGAFVPDGLWRNRYDGKFIFGDYVYGELYILEPSTPCRECVEPVPGFSNTTFIQYPGIIDAKFGPYFGTQALYYLSRDPKVRAIRRVVYTGTKENRPPVPILTSSTSFAGVGDRVEFDTSQSFDPDGDKLTFKFQNGKDKFLEWQDSPKITFRLTVAGVHRVRLRVRDTQNAQADVRLKIRVGDLPTASITSPLPGTKFSVGQKLKLSGTALDYNGDALPKSALKWEIRKHHNVHFHPFFDGTGNNLKTPAAPEPEDLNASTDSYLEIILRVKGTNSFVREVRRNVMPRIVKVDFDSSPSGMTLSIFDSDVVMPARVFCWENQFLEVNAIANPGHSFLGWSDKGPQKRVIQVESGNGGLEEEYVANYEVT